MVVNWSVKVKYAALPNFEEREEDFRAESVLLRRRFTDEGALYTGLHTTSPATPGKAIFCGSTIALCLSCGVCHSHHKLIRTADEGHSLVQPAEDKLPGHALPLSMQRLWQIIREQKDLNLPAHKVSPLHICLWPWHLFHPAFG
jgi:Root hair defective 3 GTP-binding protein (RHD3)